jgi:hypothetical protein
VAKTPDAIAEISAAVRPGRPRTWDQRVDQANQQTLRDIKAAYRRGQFGQFKKPACEAIAEYLRAHGIADVKYQEIQKWLAKPGE